MYSPSPPQQTNAVCNANPECQAFVMQRPSDTWNNMTCLLYDGNPGSSKSTYMCVHVCTHKHTYTLLRPRLNGAYCFCFFPPAFQYSDAQGNITTNRFGATIFLRWKNPTVFIPPGNPCNWN